MKLAKYHNALANNRVIIDIAFWIWINPEFYLSFISSFSHPQTFIEHLINVSPVVLASVLPQNSEYIFLA